MLSTVWAEGGKGGVEMGEKVLKMLEQPKTPYKPIYDVNASIPEKLTAIVQKVYGGDGVV